MSENDNEDKKLERDLEPELGTESAEIAGDANGGETKGETEESKPQREDAAPVEAEVVSESSECSAVSMDDVGPEQEREAEVEEVDPLVEAREEAKRVREQMLRLAADFDNYRKRARREHEDAARKAKIDVLRELLPVFDNMERAVAHAEQATDAKAVATGVEMVIRQFIDTLEKVGVSRVKALGEVFDPNVHEAIQQIETAEQAPGSVVAELLPGYVLGERLLRAAMVVVAKAPPEPEPVAEVVEAEAVAEESEGVGDRSGADVAEGKVSEEVSEQADNPSEVPKQQD